MNEYQHTLPLTDVYLILERVNAGMLALGRQEIWKEEPTVLFQSDSFSLWITRGQAFDLIGDYFEKRGTRGALQLSTRLAGPRLIGAKKAFSDPHSSSIPVLTISIEKGGEA